MDIRPDLLNEPLLQLAGDELRKINAFKSPGEKVACIVKCVAIIFRSLTLARQSYTYTNPTHGSDDGEGGKKHDDRHNTPAGADDFLPLFIWVVLHSFIPHLVSNCEYIHAYLNPARLMGKSGYCLINLRSAIEFVNYVESSGVNMPAEDFERELKEREELWDKRTGRGGVGGGDGKLKA